MFTEKEAKTKICPLAYRLLTEDRKLAGPLDEATQIYGAFCDGPGCMLWRKNDDNPGYEDRGYCGLAEKS